MLNNSARQQALRDIAAECKSQKAMNNAPKVLASRNTDYMKIFRFLNDSNQLVFEFK